MRNLSIFPLFLLSFIFTAQTIILAAPSLVQDGKNLTAAKDVSQVSAETNSPAAPEDPAQAFMSDTPLSTAGETEPAETVVKSYSMEGADVIITSETVSCGTDCTKEVFSLKVSEKGNPENVVLTVDKITRWEENPSDLSVQTEDGSRYTFSPNGVVTSIKTVYSEYAQKNLTAMEFYEFKTFKSEDGLTSRTEFIKFRETVQDNQSFLVQNTNYLYSETGTLTKKHIYRNSIDHKTYVVLEFDYANQTYEVFVYNRTMLSASTETSKLAQRPVKYLSEPALTYDSSGFIMIIDGQIRKSHGVRISIINDVPVTERYRL